MAFNSQTFKTRALTAIVFVLVMAVGLLWNPWSFFILLTIIHFGCWMEFQALVGKIDKEYQQITPFHKYGVMVAGWCFLLWFTSDYFSTGSLSLHALGWWMGLLFLFILPITEILFTRSVRLKSIGHSAFGLVYISLSLGLLMDLYNKTVCLYASDSSLASCMDTNDKIKLTLPLVVIGSLWINDTMAYLVGSMIGKTPLSKISPKKTWEGTIGGVIFTVGLAGLLAYWVDFRMISFMVTAAIAAITGIMGDLLESKLKRLAGVKDSGNLLPGHGGFLDRFDSLLIATPFVWLFVELLLESPVFS